MGDFTASNEEILRECEACEVERIFGKSYFSDKQLKLIERVYDRAFQHYHHKYFAINAVYLLGYIYGKRAERLRKKRKKQLY